MAAWSVDRLGRSLQDLLGTLGELHAKGVGLYLHQQGLDTSTPAGKAMFQMMGVFAEFERAMVRERVMAGLKRAKANGTTLGGQGLVKPRRPPCAKRCVRGKASSRWRRSLASASEPCIELSWRWPSLTRAGPNCLGQEARWRQVSKFPRQRERTGIDDGQVIIGFFFVPSGPASCMQPKRTPESPI